MLRNTAWTQLHGSRVTTMLAADLDNNGRADLVVNFPGYGVWIYRNDTTWMQLHALEATKLAAGQLDGGTQADLVIDFGPGVGLWTYRNSSTWVPLHPLTPQSLVVADFDGDGRDEVAIGFGAAGLWIYGPAGWRLVDYARFGDPSGGAGALDSLTD